MISLFDEVISEAGHRQRIAADPNHSAWVAASAGTGKTKVLSDRVLNLLLEGTAPERLLCLTYTRAAAAEMSERLAKTLALWASMPEPDLARTLAERSDEPPSGDRVRAARRLFARVLDAPGGLRIQTIHGFCQSLLARFPLEARVAPHFRVAEEATAEALLLEARRIVFSSRRADIASAIAEAAVQSTEEEFAELAGMLIKERARFARALRHHRGLDGLIATVQRLLGVTPELTTDAAIAAACQDGCFDRAGLRSAVRALLAGGRQDRERGQSIEAWLADPAARAQALTRYRLAFFTTEGEVRKKLISASAGSSAPGAQEALTAEAARLLALDDLCGRITVARATAALYRLADGILQKSPAERGARAARL